MLLSIHWMHFYINEYDFSVLQEITNYIIKLKAFLENLLSKSSLKYWCYLV